ncbi:MAG: hypothetical protein H9872_00945 [Candidatus Cellulosilyticum pullistercoris]|uniref:Uncharacterized protein n=1 Tax=Candidatus Cellulosilyticum pullistercoris TaxID=2838521 RepID=A0A9E2NJG9_9FIRM|nr:hypothetical protein [Candidatus Cellulosilyticum pullistercoris]
MSKRYRHYRVASRHHACMMSPFHQYMHEIQKQPILLLGIIFLLFMFFIKCITCHR